MKTVDDIQRFFESWMSYLATCLSLPMDAPVCRAFWQWVMIAALGIGAWLFAATAWKIIGDAIRMRRLRRLMAEREARTPEEIRRARWTGDDAYVDSNDEDLEKRIREGLDRNRAGQQATR